MGGWCGDEPGCSRELASQLPVLHRLLLSHRWNRAKLLQHPQLVMVRPMLDQFPIDKTTDVNLRPGCLLAGGGKHQEWTCLRSRCPAAGNNLLLLGNHVLDGVVKIG